MAETSIEWTMGDDGTPGKTWNPTRGCSRVSPGCERCYAERTAGRFSGPGQPYEGLVRPTPTGPRWTGEVRLVPEKLAEPLHWRKPRRVFVNSMSDLFHEKLSNEDIAAVFGVMAAAWRHTFQILTKRPDRMREWFAWAEDAPSARLSDAVGALAAAGDLEVSDEFESAVNNYVAGWSRWRDMPDDGNPLDGTVRRWPLPNVWIGVSVEDQATADERIPLLLQAPAAVHFISYEPALGPLDLSRWLGPSECDPAWCRHGFLRWVIAGSESGLGARPAELDWFRSVRDQCAAAGVSFFFKQWVGPVGYREGNHRGRKVSLPVLDGRQHVEWPT